MARDAALLEFLEKWPFESKVQREGFLNLVQYVRAHKDKLRGESPMPFPTHLVALYFIQKDHEASAWFLELLGDRVKMLEAEIVALRAEVRDQKSAEKPPVGRT